MAIGRSVSASITENRPSANISDDGSPSPSPASWQNRARTSAVTNSSRGLPPIWARIIIVVQLRTLSIPSSVTACITVLTGWRRLK